MTGPFVLNNFLFSRYPVVFYTSLPSFRTFTERLGLSYTILEYSGILSRYKKPMHRFSYPLFSFSELGMNIKSNKEAFPARQGAGGHHMPWKSAKKATLNGFLPSFMAVGEAT